MRQPLRCLLAYVYFIAASGDADRLAKQHQHPPVSRVGSGAVVASHPAPPSTAALRQRPLLQRLQGHGLLPTALSIIALYRDLDDADVGWSEPRRGQRLQLPHSTSLVARKRVQLFVPRVHDRCGIVDYVD